MSERLSRNTLLKQYTRWRGTSLTESYTRMHRGCLTIRVAQNHVRYSMFSNGSEDKISWDLPSPHCVENRNMEHIVVGPGEVDVHKASSKTPFTTVFLATSGLP